MKSCVARWNPRLARMKSLAFGFRWNQIRPSSAVRQISSRSDFIRRRWIYSAKGGFNWKNDKSKLVVFSGGSGGIRKERSDGIGICPQIPSRIVNELLCSSVRLVHLKGEKQKAVHLVWTALFCDKYGVAHLPKRDTTETPKGALSVDASAEPRFSSLGKQKNHTFSSAGFVLRKWRDS